MAVQPDDLDNHKLATIGIVGALITAAISYFAAGMYHERVEQIRAERESSPVFDEARTARDSQAPEGIEQAIREVAEGDE